MVIYSPIRRSALTLVTGSSERVPWDGQAEVR